MADDISKQLNTERDFEMDQEVNDMEVERDSVFQCSDNLVACPNFENQDSMPAGTEPEGDYDWISSSDDESFEEIVQYSSGHSGKLSNAFDVQMLQNIIELSAYALNFVEGKDVVLVAGKTGVGKSTLMQGIAGKQIISSNYETTFSGQTATKCVFEAVDPLPSFEIGHAKKSMTRSLNALPLIDSEGNEVVYLDSPGYMMTQAVSRWT